MNAFSTVHDLKRALEQKKISAAELHAFYAERIKKYNPQVNAVLETFSEKPKNDTGLLGGIPCLIKDNICQEGRTTSAGSAMLKNYKAPYQSTVAKRLVDAGAHLMGRTNMDEFAMGGSGEFSAYGAAKNPWDLSRSPGGSSSGSAAAVAAGLTPFALGTETGGSVRLPAAHCNLVGMYPTYGLHSRFGVIAFTSSTDQVGVLTRTVADNALVATTLSGQDTHDATSIPLAPKNYMASLTGKLPAGFTVGIIKDVVDTEGIAPEVRERFDASIKQLEQLGAKVKVVDVASLRYGIALYFIISRAETASNLYRYDGSLYGNRAKDAHNLIDMYLKTREHGFGSEVKRRILVGNYVLSAGHKDAYYNKAQLIRAQLRAEFEKAFHEVTVLASPTSPTLPFKLNSVLDDPIAMYLADYFNVPNCIIGTPAISVPAGFSPEGLPVGIQFFGPRLSEELLFNVAHAFEQATGYYTKTPAGFE
ncbi:Asp-tRNA(Asn)/Glu-tRNA(Gln) amidotransferase subunit GatA [Candidatus Dependentiae bacterium]|nr:Asp-tRNA(Asn)/Glu-tRNA(Gln) amidotransferase subunit GatA [Candidatus Dependentiae bacterium]